MKINIVVDSNEPSEMKERIMSRLEFIPDFTPLYTYAIGDYIVGNYIVERKTREDLWASITDGRIFKQAKAMRQIMDDSVMKVVLLIEGSRYKFSYRGAKKDYFKTRIYRENIEYGVLNSLNVDWNIPIVYTSCQKKTVDYLVKLLKKGGNTKKTFNLARKKGKITKKDKNVYMRFILEGFEGIGAKKSHKIMHEYKTLYKFFEGLVLDPIEFPLTIKRLKRVLGKSTLEKITKLFITKYDGEE